MLTFADYRKLFNSALTTTEIQANSLALAEAVVARREFSGLTFSDGSRSEKWLGNLAASNTHIPDHVWSMSCRG